MSLNQDIPAIPQDAPAPPPAEWRAGMSMREALRFSDYRDQQINDRIRRIIEARLQENYTPPGQLFINPLGEAAQVTMLPGRRIHPVTGKLNDHSGMDMVYDTPRAAGPIYAASDMEIIFVGHFSEASGQMIMGLDRDNRVVSYAHQGNGSLFGLQIGQQVKQGEQLGIYGSTGVGTGAHLHFAVRDMGPEGWAQVKAARAQRASLAGLMVQPTDVEFLPDPSRNYWKIPVVNPPINGLPYKVGDTIPGPASTVALRTRIIPAVGDAPVDVAGNVTADPAQPALPADFDLSTLFKGCVIEKAPEGEPKAPTLSCPVRPATPDTPSR